MGRISTETRKLRQTKSTSGENSYEIGIPIEMGDALYDNGITRFRIEWHEEGVLLRPATSPAESAPTWVTKQEE